MLCQESTDDFNRKGKAAELLAEPSYTLFVGERWKLLIWLKVSYKCNRVFNWKRIDSYGSKVLTYTESFWIEPRGYYQLKPFGLWYKLELLGRNQFRMIDVIKNHKRPWMQLWQVLFAAHAILVLPELCHDSLGVLFHVAFQLQ